MFLHFHCCHFILFLIQFFNHLFYTFSYLVEIRFELSRIHLKFFKKLQHANLRFNWAIRRWHARTGSMCIRMRLMRDSACLAACLPVCVSVINTRYCKLSAEAVAAAAVSLSVSLSVSPVRLESGRKVYYADNWQQIVQLN